MAKTDGRPRHCMVVFAQYPADETRVQRQAEALIARGMDVDILSLRGKDQATMKPAEQVGGAQVYRIPVTRSYGQTSFVRQMSEYLVFFWRAMVAIMHLHQSRRYTTVQVHNLPDFLVFSAWFPRIRGARVMLDLHDLMPEFLASRTGQQLSSWLGRMVTLQERLSCRFADHVVTVTEMWRDTLIRRGLPSGKVSVVMNVADDRIFKRANEGEVISRDGFLHLFYHGIIAPRAGLDLALEAIAQLHEDMPGLLLTIHGRASLHSTALAGLANGLNIADHVVFSHDLRPLPELAKLIATADVGVVPYRQDAFTDGILPTKLMEYTALGLPTIVAKTRAVEAYFDEAMVEYFTPGNLEELVAAIRKLASDRQRLRSLRRESDRFNQLYNWTSQSAGYVALVERLGAMKHRRRDLEPVE